MPVGGFRYEAMLGSPPGREREIALFVGCRAAQFVARGVVGDDVRVLGRHVAGEIGAAMDRGPVHALHENVQRVGTRRGGEKNR